MFAASAAWPLGLGRIAILASCLTLLLAACADRLHKQQSFVFGTLVEITIYGERPDKARQATDRVLRDFDQMHQALHAWQPGELETLNAVLAHAQPGQPARLSLSPRLASMLQDATRLSERSEGLFNPAIGQLVRLWGFHSDAFEPRLPDPRAIERLVAAHPSMRELRIEGNRAEAENPALRLDLGGYAKGYALDQAAATLKSLGVRNALINIGGNILALGSKGGTPWSVGIQHPRRAGALAKLELHDGEAIGTSGDYQRYFEVAGKRYCHLIDPRTGWPATATQAVTVIARGEHAGTLSDVASKPLFIAGAVDWPRLARKMGVREVLFIAADGSLGATPSMWSRLVWDKTAPSVRIVEDGWAKDG